MCEGKTEIESEREVRRWPSSGLTSSFNEGPNNPERLLHREEAEWHSKGILLTLRDTSAIGGERWEDLDA